MTASASHPFIDWFGIATAIIQRVLSESMSRGADFADLDFQHVNTTSLAL